MKTILIVEDTIEGYQLAARALSASFRLEWAQSLSEAQSMLDSRKYDLILLDVVLPDGDGYHLCSILQNDDQLSNVPIIFLTAKDAPSDTVLGFSLGADDYITKPFDPLILKARVNAKLRKLPDPYRPDIIRLGPLEINKDSQSVEIHLSGKTQVIELTPIEFKILLKLTKQTNTVYGRNDILDAVWGQDIHVAPRSVDTHVSKLRRKLGPYAKCIQSVHGTGYRFSLDENPA